MKRSELKQIIKEEVFNILNENWTPTNKDVLRNDIGGTIQTLKNILPNASFSSLSRFASGSSSELYINVYHKPGENIENDIQKHFLLKEKTPSGMRNVYFDKQNNVHFRVKPWDENETVIIFTRNSPKGRGV
jgi:hypothetical protein